MIDYLLARLTGTKKIGCLAAGSACLLILMSTGLHEFVVSQSYGGRDLSANYALSKVLADKFLSAQYLGIQENFLLGFPGLNAYPPGFFISTSFLSSIPFLTHSTVFKSVVTGSVLLVPFILSTSFEDADKKAFVSFYSLIFLAGLGTASIVYQALSFGFVSQTVSFVFLAALFRSLWNNKSRESAIFLFLAAVFHPYTGLTGLIMYLSFAVFSDNLRLRPLLYLSFLAPWVFTALSIYSFSSLYQMPAAVVDVRIMLLSPLIALGIFKGGSKRKSVGMAALILGILTYIENPFLNQEARFVVQFAFLSVLSASFGAYSVVETMENPRWALILLFLPVPLLATGANADPSAHHKQDVDRLIDQMKGLPEGDVIVETTSDDVKNTFVPHSAILTETDHHVVNEVHLDSSTAANSILTLESFISKDPVNNTICKTCSIDPSDELILNRLNDMSIEYVITVGEPKPAVSRTLNKSISSGRYTLFSVPNISTNSRSKGWKIKSSYEIWKQVNYRLIDEPDPPRIYWSPNDAENPSSVVISQSNISESIDYIKSRRGNATVAETCRNISWAPYYVNSRPTNFNLLAGESCDPEVSRLRSVRLWMENTIRKYPTLQKGTH